MKPVRRLLILSMALGACSDADSQGPNPISDEESAIIRAALEYMASDSTLPRPLPVDVRLAEAHPEGGMVPVGTVEHQRLPPSTVLRAIAREDTILRLVEAAGWSEERLVLTVGRPIWINDAETVVNVAVVHRNNTEPRSVSRYERYRMTRTPSGNWTVRDVYNDWTDG